MHKHSTKKTEENKSTDEQHNLAADTARSSYLSLNKCIIPEL